MERGGLIELALGDLVKLPDGEIGGLGTLPDGEIGGLGTLPDGEIEGLGSNGVDGNVLGTLVKLGLGDLVEALEPEDSGLERLLDGVLLLAALVDDRPTEGIGFVIPAKGVAMLAIVQEAGVGVAVVVDAERVTLQPVLTVVLVVQLLEKSGVPEDLPVLIGVQETTLLVTVVVGQDEAVVVVSVGVTLQPVATSVLVVQLSVRMGVPELIVLVTDVHET